MSIADREHGVEHLVQPDQAAFLGRYVLLEKVLKRAKLDIQEVGKRHLPLRVQLAEIKTTVPVSVLRHVSLYPFPLSLVGLRSSVLGSHSAP